MDTKTKNRNVLVLKELNSIGIFFFVRKTINVMEKKIRHRLVTF